MGDGSLEAYRKAHEAPEYAGFLGNAHGMRFSSEHMSLYLGREDYLELIQTEDGRKKLALEPLLDDWRIEEFRKPEFEPYYWVYYYSCFCSVTRSAFDQAGGFDEIFVSWGSEDNDFGYRISACGRIGYLPNVHGFHLPHPRNLWDENLFDHDNIRYMLDKYRCWQIELMMSFDTSGKMYTLVDRIRKDIRSWNLTYMSPQTIPETIWINIPTEMHPDETVIWYNRKGEEIRTSLLGISVPCCDLYFSTAYITADIFCYPMVITSRILQECLRISKKVVLLPVKETRRYRWPDACLAELPELYRSVFPSNDTMEYQFLPERDGSYQVVSSEMRERLQKTRSQCPIFPGKLAREKWREFRYTDQHRFILVNLTNRDTETIREKLEHALGTTFEQSYTFTPSQKKTITLQDALPLAVCQITSPLFLVVNACDRVIADDYWNSQRANTEGDLIFDLSGDLKRLQEKT